MLVCVQISPANNGAFQRGYKLLGLPGMFDRPYQWTLAGYSMQNVTNVGGELGFELTFSCDWLTRSQLVIPGDGSDHTGQLQLPAINTPYTPVGWDLGVARPPIDGGIGWSGPNFSSFCLYFSLTPAV